jgi:3'-5' exoribonuclease
MKMGAISNLKVGEQVKIRLFMKACDVRKTNSKPPRDYLDATFTDGQDDLNGKMWNYVHVGNLPEQKKCYDIIGTIGEYQGRKQITLTSYTLSADQDTTAFQLSIGVSIDELWAAAMQAIDGISNTKLRDIVLTVYNRYKDILAPATSAKAVHHVGAGGNILHSLEVHNIGCGIFDAYSGQSGYEKFSKNLVKAGALLHDIGKAKVYEIEGPAVDYTYVGYVHDHIVAGIQMLLSIDWPEDYHDLIDLLVHIIASHHGKLEYGSPTTPKFMEAYIVNHADGISATMDALRAANEKVTDGNYVTEKIFSCNNTQHITQAHVISVVAAK